MKHLPQFPNPETADATGLVAVTQALSPQLLLAAYSQGIFPWSDHPVQWYSPQPRAVFKRPYIHVPRNLAKLTRRAGFTVRFDTAFAKIIQQCAQTHASEGEWISDRFQKAYQDLHQLGYAHSVEVWQGSALVGGLYGVQLGGLFAGESMFYLQPNASKLAFAALVGQLDSIGTLLFDAQVINAHTAQLGAVLVHRTDYLRLLNVACQHRCLYAEQKWPAEPRWDLFKQLKAAHPPKDLGEIAQYPPQHRHSK